MYVTRKIQFRSDIVKKRDFLLVFRNDGEETREILEATSFLESFYSQSPITTVRVVSHYIAHFLNFCESKRIGLCSVDAKVLLDYLSFYKKRGCRNFKRPIQIIERFLNHCVEMSEKGNEKFKKSYKWTPDQILIQNRGSSSYPIKLNVGALAHSEQRRYECELEVKFLSDEELDLILAEAKSNPMLYALILFMKSTSLRISEALSFKMSDIPDNLKEIVEFRFRYKRKGQGSTVEDQKLNKSWTYKKIPAKLVGEMLEVTRDFRKQVKKNHNISLEKHRRSYKTKKKQFSKKFFITKTGISLTTAQASAQIRAISEKLGIQFRSHDLRRHAINQHFVNFGLYSAQELGKHKNPNTTEKHYIDNHQHLNTLKAMAVLQERMK